MELKLPYKLYPIAIENHFNRMPLHFIVVGAGGTGGYLIRDLSRLIGVNNNKYGLEASMTIIDGDQVRCLT
jgi:tRNA A37 threonylcarbamoyladenosine dehydratase